MSSFRKVVTVASLLVFGVVTVLVCMNSADSFDSGIRRWFQNIDGQPVAAARLLHHVRDISALGGWALLILLTITVSTGLAIAGRRRDSNHIVFAMVSGMLIVIGLKYLIGRPRPEFPTSVSAGMPSYPSGHAMMSAVLYLTLAALLARESSARPLKRFFFVTAILLTTGIGLTRVYLSVHYPSDVVGGWALGVAWTTLCWSAIQRRPKAGSDRPRATSD